MRTGSLDYDPFSTKGAAPEGSGDRRPFAVFLYQQSRATMSRKKSIRKKSRSRREREGRAGRQNRRRGARNGDARSNGSTDGGWVRHGTALPGWTDLEPSRNRRRNTSDASFLEEVSTGRFVLLLLAVAGAFTLYVGHVHTTTDLLDRLQEVRAENRRLHLKHNRLQGEFDRKTGPSVIYERAREIGLRASVSYGPPVNVE